MISYYYLDVFITIAMRSVQHSVLQSKAYQWHQDIVEFIRYVYRSSLAFGSILVLTLYSKLSWPDFYPLHKLINDPKIATHYERTRRLSLTDHQWKDIADYFKQTNDLVEWVIKCKQPAAVSHVDYDKEIKKIFVEEN